MTTGQTPSTAWQEMIPSRAALAADILIGGPGADTLDGGEEYRERDDMVPVFDATTGDAGGYH